MRFVARVSMTICLAAAVCTAILSPAAAQDNQRFKGQVLNAASWGGNTSKAIRGGVLPVFEKDTGATAQWTDGDALEFTAQLAAAKGGTPPYDVVGIENLVSVQAADQKLIVVPDYDKIPNGKLLGPNMLHPSGHGPAFGYYRLVMGYLPDKFKAAGIPEPKDMSVIFDPRLAGHLSMPDVTQANWPLYMPVFAAFFNAPLSDPSATIGKIAGIKQVMLYASSSDLEARMSSGEIWLSLWIDGRINALKTKGLDIAIAPLGVPNPKGGTYDSAAGLLMFEITNPAKKELAEIFLNDLLSTEAQVKFALGSGYTPTNLEAVKIARADPKMGSFIDTDPGRAYQADYEAWLKVQDKWIDAWGKAMRR